MLEERHKLHLEPVRVDVAYGGHLQLHADVTVPHQVRVGRTISAEKRIHFRHSNDRMHYESRTVKIHVL